MKQTYNLVVYITTLLSIFSSFYFGYLTILLNIDFTFITHTILVLFIFVNSIITFQTFKNQSSKDYQWFMSDLFLSLGLVGTIAGMILSFTALGGFDPSNVESAKIVLTSISSGLSIALYTTLMGLICSIVTKIQLIICDLDEK